MVFSSHIFVFYFLPLALALYYLLPRGGRHLGLTFASYVFYGWSNPAFIVLMATSTAVDYLCGLIIAGQHRADWSVPVQPLAKDSPRTSQQRLAVAISVAANLSLLGFFKYFNFGIDTYNALVTTLGFEHLGLDSVLRVVLPLGISFYTFQSMSYSIDVYRGDARCLRNLIDFSCYVSMFPQLVAGPIIRFSEIEDQLHGRLHTLEKFARGISFFSFGMAKKVLLANPCGKVADTIFDSGSVLPLDAWYGALAYSFQIYFDFSGYSDMAIGLGLMLGFVFPKNFDSPYQAESITDFWRRWHMSLSTWLRDYLYKPLGGNRRGRRRTYINLGLVMLLGGLWHGAAWNFAVWGGLHGAFLAAERLRDKRSLFSSLPRPLRVAGTFLLVLISWVFFRSPDLASAVDYLLAMAAVGAAPTSAALAGGLVFKPYYLATVAAAGSIAWFAPQTWDFTRRISAGKAALAVLVLWLALAVLTTQAYNPFIYFIF